MSISATFIGLIFCGLAAAASEYSSTVVTLYESQRTEEVRVLLRHQDARYAELAYPNPQALITWLNGLDTVGDNPVQKFK